MLDSRRATVVRVALSVVGLKAAYAAASRAVLLSWMYVNSSRPKSTARSRKKRKTGTMRANSTRPWPRERCRFPAFGKRCM